MSDETTLLPCPCCGSEHVETCREFWGGAAPAGSEFSDEVICDDCGLTAPSIRAWNTRTPEQVVAATLGGGRVTEDGIDKWMRSFQSEHGELAHIGHDELRELAFALHDDIPLGYEASMRLADWLLHAKLGGGESNYEKLFGTRRGRSAQTVCRAGGACSMTIARMNA